MKAIRVFIGTGSNLGDKEKNIRDAISLLGEKCRVLRVSPLYKTKPEGYKDQDWFFNGAVEGETGLKAGELLDFLQEIERKLKRVKTIKNGPRSIDLDILFYGDEIIKGKDKEKDLTIPHPRLHKRLFVLKPLNDLCPALLHPVLKKEVREMLCSLESKAQDRRCLSKL